MLLKAFSLLDTKTGAFSRPFFVGHTGDAIRMTIDIGSAQDTLVGRYPADYELVEIGLYNDQTGELSSVPHIHLGTVLSYLPSRPRPIVEATPNE